MRRSSADVFLRRTLRRRSREKTFTLLQISKNYSTFLCLSLEISTFCTLPGELYVLSTFLPLNTWCNAAVRCILQAQASAQLTQPLQCDWQLWDSFPHVTVLCFHKATSSPHPPECLSHPFAGIHDSKHAKLLRWFAATSVTRKLFTKFPLSDSSMCWCT